MTDRDLGYLSAKVEELEKKVDEVRKDVKSLLAAKNRLVGWGIAASSLIGFVTTLLLRMMGV